MSKHWFLRFLVKLLIFILIVIGIIAGLIYLEIFSIKDQTLGDLIIGLHSSQKSINVNSGDSANVTFYMRALPRLGCSSECRLSFFDSSHDILVDSSAITLENSFQEYTKTYNLQAPQYGEGQIIYSFNAECRNVYTKTCEWNYTFVKKTSLITLNYKLSEEFQKLKPELRQRLEDLLNHYSKTEVRYKNLKLALNLLSLTNQAMDEEFAHYSEMITALVDLWNQQRYDALDKSMNVNLTGLEVSLNSSFQPVREFNSLVSFAERTSPEIPIVLGISDQFRIQTDKDLMKKFSALMESLNSRNLEAAKSYDLQFESGYFDAKSASSKVLESVMNESNLTASDNLTGNLYSMRDYCMNQSSTDARSKRENQTNPACEKIFSIDPNQTLEFNLSKIPEDFNISESKFSLNENPPICCAFGKCAACCTNSSCAFTPLILVHGHLFNDQNSPDYSVIEFELLQDELEKNGYINAGMMTPDSSISEVSAGEWGLSGNTLSVSASYYAEKNLSISDYAKSLKNEIEIIKFRTGQKKVDIVAYSMGGLVTREYLKQFGDDSISKIIFVAAPQNGTGKTVSALCPIFGASIECTEMQSGSEFINELNSNPPKNIQMYNIIGSGCLMEDNQDGDGIVILKNAVLMNPYHPVETFVINGNCPSASDLLHTSILNVQKHPETFQKMMEILRSQPVIS